MDMIAGYNPDPQSLLRPPGVKTESAEWESTVTFRLNKRSYDLVLAADDRTIRHDVIFVFSDDRRLSARTFQSKVTTERKRVLGFYEGRMYPICRTRAVERTANIDSAVLSIEKAVHRLIVTDPEGEERDPYASRVVCDEMDTESNRVLRIAFNKEETEEGARYNLTCEAEYPDTSSYSVIIENERWLMQNLYRCFERWNTVYALNDVQITPDRLTLSEMFACIVPKVQMWHCFNPNDEYLWAHKWNGVKAKFMYVNQHAYIWPDTSEIFSAQYDGDLSPLDCMCLQVELMDDRIVIVEVVAASFYGDIYSAEPQTNVRMLRYLMGRFGNNVITVDGKRLTVQVYYNTRLPKCFDLVQHDGFIIVQKDLTIKWKPPSVDVKCVKTNKFVVGSNSQPIEVHLQEPDRFEGEPGAIYEMSSNFRVLRKRTDRTACSTTREYEVFLESRKLIYR